MRARLQLAWLRQGTGVSAQFAGTIDNSSSPTVANNIIVRGGPAAPGSGVGEGQAEYCCWDTIRHGLRSCYTNTIRMRVPNAAATNYPSETYSEKVLAGSWMAHGRDTHKSTYTLIGKGLNMDHTNIRQMTYVKTNKDTPYLGRQTIEDVCLYVCMFVCLYVCMFMFILIVWLLSSLWCIHN